MDTSDGCTVTAEPCPGFILNMTSDAKVRSVVEQIRRLSNITAPSPEMGWYDLEFDPLEDEGPFLPFTTYVITGTAGAGKSTSVSALYQNLNCLVTGATTVAAQNLSRCLKAYCPTIYHAFGFKSRHINLQCRKIPRVPQASVEQIQRQELARYWPIIADIMRECMTKKQKGQYAGVSDAAFDMLCKMGGANLWTSNIILIDEAGTLSSHILTAVVFFYWFYNSWLETPLFRRGAVPCIVCVGSPTQTDAYQSVFNHAQQRSEISACENVLTFLMGKAPIANYVRLEQNWALFINNKRCTDPQFGHLLKTLEYNLDISADLMGYIDRFVVPRSRILDPLEYVGWTRLFLSHQEVKNFLSTLHACLVTQTETGGAKLFTCPVVCEVFTAPFEEYKRTVGITQLSPLEWVSKNLFRLSNYSQFVDQDMEIVGTEVTEGSTQITFASKFVKNSYASLNGKTRKCICGYHGSYQDFKRILDGEVFIESHSHDNPEYVYYFLSTLLYNAMYSFYAYGRERACEGYLNDLRSLPVPREMTGDSRPEDSELFSEDTDMFYFAATPPPTVSNACLPTLVAYYTAAKDVFSRRLSLAMKYFGPEVARANFSAFTVNMVVRDGVDFVSTAPNLPGLVAYASTVESYRIQGYTFLPVRFGRGGCQRLSEDLRKKMPLIVVQDTAGFIACLENNVTRLSETLEGGDVFNVCCAGDYGVSSNLAMTIVKAQGVSLGRVAVSFGSHKHVRASHVYVAISRAMDARYLVMDGNPLKFMERGDDQSPSSKYIVQALCNPKTTLIY
ncbi:helicase-primase helicase subunit [Colobine gammaherpesvirus 1]|uniref:Helicase-primase helicase subunit n=1 Tax=Colobine gammaherpesvirus 1 TaxID=2597325 RepID=A0A5B8G407_9GAMA|nr:helicase-primase helicase subunit [Colobine gammaherpesvirus 1]QDQ69251.1 helicase-primase helicase subunit [Colobine gammaherpesvirus 1]